jgi:demethylmenaquinone methyltransferase / 2-methoxy-6-polyprenyl-1,4-benzoquinol methylase|tara:strand:+ start:3924 stop:4661 length:738 start_codon:yes stop_codon:yes gene_type:complete
LSKQKNTDFGYETITKAEKRKKVGAVFDSVATNYDLMNNLMSMGLHHVWKKILIETTTLKPKSKILDIAGGTADITIEFLKKNKDFKIFHTDINLSMLKKGRRKLIDHGKIIPSLLCDAEALPFPNNYFDCVTISFGLRNMTNKEEALKEIYRVLSPGGKIVILEFSKIWKPLKKLYDDFSFKIVPKLGKLFAKDEKSYKYLVESIRMHPDQKKLIQLLENQGFEKTTFMNLSAGIVAIHKGYKF